MQINQKDCEYLVIGSGAGGAVAFKTLSAEGKNVLLIEEGKKWNPEDFNTPIGLQIQKLYRNGGIIPINGNPTIGFGEGIALGGSTVVNGGLLWRTPNWVLNYWKENFKIDGYEIKNLEKHFKNIEKNLGVSLEHEIIGADLDSTLIKNSAEKLHWKIEMVPRATTNCNRSNQCGVGCPSGAKQSVDKNYILEGNHSGGKILTQTRVDKLFTKKNRIFKVEATDLVSNQKIIISPKKVFMAAGALNSPALLKKSGIYKSLNFNLNFHLNLRIFSSFSNKLNSENATMFIYQIQEFAKEGILIMGTNFRPSYVASALSHLSNEEIIKAFDEYEYSALYTTMVKPLNSAKIYVTPNGDKVIKHNLNNNDLSILKRSLYLTSKLLFHAGAKKVVLPLTNCGPLFSLLEAENAINKSKLGHFSLVSVHAMSSCAMGVESDDICNINGKYNNLDNLYVCDASILPSSTYESPQGTIMAVSHEILERYLNN